MNDLLMHGPCRVSQRPEHFGGPCYHILLSTYLKTAVALSTQTVLLQKAPYHQAGLYEA